MSKFTAYRQLDQMDCGPTCLRMVAKHHGKDYTCEFLREKCYITREGVSVLGISDAAAEIGLRSLAVSVPFTTLSEEVPLPCIAHWRQRHFVVIYEVKKEHVYIADPAFGLIDYPKEKFMQGWLNERDCRDDDEGLLLLLEPTPDFYEKEEPKVKANRGLSFLIPYFKPYRSFIFQLLLGLFIGTVLQLIFPFLTQAVVDHGIRNQNISFVYLVLIAQLTLFLSQTAVNVIRGWLLLHLGSRINISLIADFLVKIMRLPIAFFNSRMIGDLLQRIDDHKRIEIFLSSSTLEVIFSAFNLLVFGAILAFYDFSIFMIFLIGTIIYMLWVLFFMKRRAVLDYKIFDQSSENRSSLIQLFNGMQEIKLNNSETRRRWEWESIQVKLFKISLQGLALAQSQGTGAIFINEAKNILITFIAAKAVIEGELTLGMMLAVQYIIGQLNRPINDFITFIQAAQDAKLSMKRLTEIHGKDNEENAEEKINTIPGNKSIVLSNVSFQYGSPGSAFVLKNLDLEIPAGKVTAIVGASGSGKTTLLKLMVKFYKPTAGKISLGNTDLENLSTGAWRRNCGVVMQDGFIFADTIARNITESGAEAAIDKERLLYSVRLANIEEMIESLPRGYNTNVSWSGIALSGGQQQRVLIARAIYKDPNFLFFDEATSALDANNEKIIMENLQQFYKGKTVVVIAHRLSTVKNADQIVVLDKGAIVEKGTHDELVSNRGAYYTLIKNQLELGK